MANLIYAISTSLDGYIADENGNFDWSQQAEGSGIWEAWFHGAHTSMGALPAETVIGVQFSG